MNRNDRLPEPENGPNAPGLDQDDLDALKDQFGDAPRIDLESRPDTNIYGTKGEVRPPDSISRMAEEVADNVRTPQADPPQPSGPDLFSKPDASLHGELGRPYESAPTPIPDAPGGPRGPQQGLTRDDLDRLKWMEEEIDTHGHLRTESEVMLDHMNHEPPEPVLSKKPETFTDRQTKDAIDRIDERLEHPRPMDIDDAANFETFPPLPDKPAGAPRSGPRPQGLSKDDLDALRAMEADSETLSPVPGAENIEALRATLGDPIDLEAPGDPNLVMEQELTALGRTEPDHSGFGLGNSPMMLGLAGAAVVVALVMFGALWGRGGTDGPAAPTAPGAPTGTAVASAPKAGGAAWPGCTAAPVPASAADAIPKEKRWLVASYCFGAHYYPTEQFQWSSAPGCTEPGVIGNASHLVTKSGGPAAAIDDPAASLPDPRPGGCGFLAFFEAKEQERAIQGKFPDNASNMYPAATETYRAFQAKAGGAR